MGAIFSLPTHSDQWYHGGTTLTIPVLQGGFGTVSNAIILVRLLRLQNQPLSETEATQYLRRKIAFTASLVIQSTLAAADIAIAAVVTGKISKEHTLTSVAVLAFIAG